MSSSRKTASVTAVVRSSLYESLLEKLSSEHQALLSELGSARYPPLPPSLLVHTHLFVNPRVHPIGKRRCGLSGK
jgi:hypothetical protein